jgi:hypothetical protein
MLPEGGEDGSEPEYVGIAEAELDEPALEAYVALDAEVADPAVVA